MEVAHSERYKREEDLCRINILLMVCTCHASGKLNINPTTKLKLMPINTGKEFIFALFAVGITALRGGLRKVRSRLTVKYYEQCTCGENPAWHEYSTAYCEINFDKALWLSMNRTLSLAHAYWGDWLRRHLRKANKCFATAEWGFVWGSAYFKNERVYL